MKASAPGPDGRTITIDDASLAAHRRKAAAAGATPGSDPARLAFAAAHVVMRASYRQVPHSLAAPAPPEAILEHIDWPATMAIRSHLDARGFGIAEAMDTAQRFFLGWPGAERLIRACGELGLRRGFIAGAGADHQEHIGSRHELVDGVVYQAHVIQQCGGMPILLPQVWLAQNARGEDDYVDTYAAIFDQLAGPLFVHWLGPMFLPALQGYFPGQSFARVMALDPAKVRGCKLSLLDAGLERRVRRACLERDQIVLTGDDLHFARLLLGGGEDAASPAPIERFTTIGTGSEARVGLGDFSHALLGILNAIAAPAALALELLAQGDAISYLAIMEPCERLGEWLFQPPTAHYKAGLAFLAWLCGLQDNPMLMNHEERARDHAHYLRAAELAAACGALTDAPLAAARLRAFAAGGSA